MHILYVVARPIEINTSASIRNQATIIGLLRNGHQVTVVSAKPDRNHPAYDGSMEAPGAELKYFDIGGIQSAAKLGRRLHVPNKVKSCVNGLLSGNEIYDNLKGIVHFAKEIDLGLYDMAVSSSDPKSSHLFVDSVFKESGKEIPWIQIWGDPFAEDITNGGGAKKKLAAEREERRLLGMADKIVYVSKLTCDSQKGKYGEDAGKMHYLPTPYSSAKITGKEMPRDYRDAVLCYCGDYGSRVRDIRPLYGAVRKLGMRLIICGISDLELEETDKIKILPRQPMDAVRRIESDADILVHLSNLSGTQIPGKIYQYASTDRTVLFILDGEKKAIREMFVPYGRFVFTDNEEDAIMRTLKNICALSDGVGRKPLVEFDAGCFASELVKL